MSLVTVPAVRVSAGWTVMEMIPFVSGDKNTEVLVRREGGSRAVMWLVRSVPTIKE